MKKIMDKIKTLLQKAIDQNEFPGCQYALITPSHIAYDALGYKMKEPTKVLNVGDEIYDVASLTKVVSTTTLMMHLIEEKKLTLNTLVKAILPWFKHKEVKISDLLSHQSGLPADISKAATLKTEKEVMDRIKAMGLIYPTGTDIVYSDVGYILLGKIIESISGKPIDVLADQVIFKPLQMHDTSYHPDRIKAAPTELREDSVYQGLLQGMVHDEKAFAMKGLAGHAGLFSTAKDLAKFIQAMLNNQFVLKKASIDVLFKEAISIEKAGQKLVRTFGWQRPQVGSYAGNQHDVCHTIGHTGFTGCHLFIDRKTKIGFVLLSNAVHPKRNQNGILKYRNQIGNMIYKEMIK